jgi:hypothetical protein
MSNLKAVKIKHFGNISNEKTLITSPTSTSLENPIFKINHPKKYNQDILKKDNKNCSSHA